MVLEVYICLP